MAFVQIIEFRTSRLGEMRKVEDEWEQATEGKRKTARRILGHDRDNPDRYFEVVFFDSHDDAVQNSALPETDALSKKMMGLAEGPAIFYNLDVEDDRSG
jgi:hypothetical protein